MNRAHLIRPARRSGVALIIVLAMLVLLSGLLIAFLNTVTTERNSTNLSANTASARALADSTTNLVIGQLREATTRYTNVASWASQPGAIRTFSGTEGPRRASDKGSFVHDYLPGQYDFVYKLYSSENMKVRSADYETTGGELKQEIDAIQQFRNSVAQPDSAPPDGYVDLNEPFVSRQPNPQKADEFFYDPRYPIIDPRARLTDKETTANNTYGIVEGFDATITELPNEKRLTDLGAPIKYLPMPVKWLYVLKDGTIGSISKATDTNPVVGRTAFWTDDECAKLNINIASEGTYWDTPMSSIEQESGNVSSTGNLQSSTTSLSLGSSQPAKGEYQRYPGHPATTCLSPVLGWLWKLPRPLSPVGLFNNQVKAYKQAIYKISPFLPGVSPNFGTEGVRPNGLGTSFGATDNTDDVRPDGGGLTGLKFGTTEELKLSVLTKHLYNNVDEFIFQSHRYAGTSAATYTGLVHDNTLDPKALEKVRGFITANSRAPELNLFNRPRVTFWPVNNEVKKRSNFDHLFTFASTIGDPNKGTRRFYFERREAKSDIIDLFLPQNIDMFKYLQWLTGDAGKDIPGFGGSMLKKYPDPNIVNEIGSDRDQILMEIFDYVRSVNLVDTGTNRLGTLKFIPYTPFFGVSGRTYGNVARSFDWSGQVTPSTVPTTGGHPLPPLMHGMGRFATISEAALAFYRSGDIVPGQEQRKMQAVLLLEFVTPSPGFPAYRDTYWTKMRVKRPTTAQAVFAGAGTPAAEVELFKISDPDLVNIVNISSHEVYFGRGFMPTLGFLHPMAFYPEHFANTNPDLYPNDPSRNPASTFTLKQFRRHPTGASTNYARNQTIGFYPYVGPDTTPGTPLAKGMDIHNGSAYASTFNLKGGQFEVEIWAGENPSHPSSRLVQTIALDFGVPSGAPVVQALPVPRGATNMNVEWQTRFRHDSGGWRDVSQEGRPRIFSGFFNGTNRTEDQVGLTTVRSIEYVGETPPPNAGRQPLAQQGDYRHAMLKSYVPPNAFHMRDPSRWTQPGVYMVHAFNGGHGDRSSTSLNGGEWGGGYSPTTVSQSGTFGTNSNGNFHGSKFPVLPANINGVKTFNNSAGDFDRGVSKHLDSAAFNKVDEGNVYFGYNDSSDGGKVPYFRGRGIEETGQSFFSPNRQLPSAVMFGSLPTGVKSRRPWQTLLFRPDRSSIPHPGATGPHDHLWLDLFHLPIVEPYAISEPFSTAGKVNLNYIMAPFGYVPAGRNLPRINNDATTQAPSAYIHRDTALRGVLRSTKVTAVPTNAANHFHAEGPANHTGVMTRYDVDLDETIAHIQKRLLDPKRGLFRSASEICTVDFYPEKYPGGVSNWQQFWDVTNTLTGDNQRERPYAHVYPRVTTKSNVFTVHMRCQTVRVKASARKEGKIDYAALKDADIDVTGEYRGSATVERFVDPNDDDLAAYDYMQSTVDPYYRFRVVATKQFTPR